MELSKQVTSLELSKKLRELGVKQESYFIYLRPSYRIGEPRFYKILPNLPKYNKATDVYPAYTVAELGEMLPDLFSSHKHKSSWLKPWLCEFFDGDKLNKEYADTEADARAKMLIYLLENGLLVLN